MNSRSFEIIIAIVGFCFSCSPWKNIKNASDAFELKMYSKASEFYKADLETATQKSVKADLSYQIGLCYDMMGQYSNGLKWYKKSYELQNSTKALIKYAYALKRNEDYKEALDAFAELSNESIGQNVYRREANICKLAIDWIKPENNKFNYQIQVLPINDQSNDYAPVFDRTGKLFFTSDRLGSTGRKKYDWSGLLFSDLYSSSKSNEVSALNANVNTENNEGTCSFYNYKDEMLFTRCADLSVANYYCQIYSILLENNDRRDNLLDLGGGLSNSMHPALHYSDSILVFSSDRENGQGQYDLYIAKWREDKWDQIENLGSKINTTGNEKFPVWYKDTLYFSSDYHPGLGGLDIFKTWINTDGQWNSPQRLEYPINSGGDDFNYSIDPIYIAKDSIIQRAIFSSNRNDSKGDDLFEVFVLNKRTSTVKSSSYTIRILATLEFYKTKEYSANQKDESLDSVSLRINNDPNALFTGNKSSLSLQLEPNQQYEIMAGRKNYLNSKLSIKTPDTSLINTDSTIQLNYKISLVPYEFDKEYLLKDVFYDFDRSEIRKDALTAVNELYELLISNPKITVEIASHTDCRGELEYNLNLSTARALSVYNYLIQKGISSQRIRYMGYGETKPIVLCKCNDCTEEQHQKNRRSTFKLIR